MMGWSYAEFCRSWRVYVYVQWFTLVSRAFVVQVLFWLLVSVVLVNGGVVLAPHNGLTLIGSSWNTTRRDGRACEGNEWKSRRSRYAFFEIAKAEENRKIVEMWNMSLTIWIRMPKVSQDDTDQPPNMLGLEFGIDVARNLRENNRPIHPSKPLGWRHGALWLGPWWCGVLNLELKHLTGI